MHLLTYAICFSIDIPTDIEWFRSAVLSSLILAYPVSLSSLLPPLLDKICVLYVLANLLPAGAYLVRRDPLLSLRGTCSCRWARFPHSSRSKSLSKAEFRPPVAALLTLPYTSSRQSKLAILCIPVLKYAQEPCTHDRRLWFLIPGLWAARLRFIRLVVLEYVVSSYIHFLTCTVTIAFALAPREPGLSGRYIEPACVDSTILRIQA